MRPHPSHSPRRDRSKVPSPSLHLSSGENAGLRFFSVALGARSIWEISHFYILECYAVYIMSSHS